MLQPLDNQTTILVVEDNADLREIFVRLFKTRGFDVEYVCDGPQAIAYLAEKGLPRIVVMDVNMPGQSGLEVLRHLREIDTESQTRVILVTGDHLANTSEEAKLADLFLMKPVSLVELHTMVKRLLLV